MKIIQEQENRQAMRLSGKIFLLAGAAILIILAVGVCFFLFRKEYSADFARKAGLLWQEALTEETRMELGISPAGAAGYAVFFSVSDGIERAEVCHGIGATLDAAWEDAVGEGEKMMRKSRIFPKWVKADLVYDCRVLSAGELEREIFKSAPSSLRYGLAMDKEFKTALLEEELNGAGIYDYDTDKVNPGVLNQYLRSMGRRTQAALPGEFPVFRCFSWLCDEQDAVWELGARVRDMGRRNTETPDGKNMGWLADNASAYLVRMVQEKEAFPKAVDARFHREDKAYEESLPVEIVEALLTAYHRKPDEELKKAVEDAISMLLEKITPGTEDSALLLPGLTEYMDVFQSSRYREECIAIGGELIRRMNQDTGEFSPASGENSGGNPDADSGGKEKEDSSSCGGAVVCAFCRLYKLTGDEKWLDAARLAADRLVLAGASSCGDFMTCRAMKEITAYEPKRAEYYGFVLETAQRKLEIIADKENPEPSDLEILTLAYEMYCRMEEQGGMAEGFDLQRLLEAAAEAAERQLNGYFYPEYAMYMESPNQILDTFMVRQENFRVSPGGISRAVTGCYLYAHAYQNMKADGLEEYFH